MVRGKGLRPHWINGLGGCAVYQPCRLLYEQLLEVAQKSAGNPESAARSFQILIDCNAKGDCPEGHTCRSKIVAAFETLGQNPPFTE